MTASRTRAVATETFVIGDMEPAIQVAFPMTPDAATLGLDRPTGLLGGAALPPEALASATGLDHVLGLRAFLAEACRSQTNAGRNWFGHPPLVLVGPAGFGRGHVARRVAHLAGVPLVEAGGAELCDVGRGPGIRTRDVPIPVLAIALTRCANPIVLLDLEGASPNPLGSRRLAAMMDPLRTGRWLHEGMRTVFDLSHVSWIVQAPDRSHAVAAIEAHGGRVIPTTPESDVREELRRLSVAQQVASDGGRGVPDPHLVAAILRDLEHRFANDAPPGRALFDHAVASRDQLRTGG